MSIGKASQYICNTIQSEHVHVAMAIILAFVLFVILSTVPISDSSDAESTVDITVVANNDTMGLVTGSGTYAVNSTQIITALANEGYTFVQWDDGNNQSVRTITVTGDATYTAQFEANQYTVTLDNQSPTEEGDICVTATYAQYLPNIIVPTKTDYEFRGYYTGMNGTGEKYIASDGTSLCSYLLTFDLTLYAYWYQNTHIVTFHTVGADVDGTTSVVAVVGLAFPDIIVPTRTDYQFAGYYTGVNGSGQQYVDSSGHSTKNFDIDNDVTLYAKWISFNGITVVDCGVDSVGRMVWIYDSSNQLSIFGSCEIPNYSADTMPWHSYKSSINSLFIEETITSIGSYAFQGCSALRELTIPDSVTSLGAYCFFDCSGLERLTIPISLRASDYASGGSEGSYSDYYGGMSYYRKVTEGYTGSCYFGGCTGITYLHLTVGDGDGAVYGSKIIAKKTGNTRSPVYGYTFYEITTNSYYDYEYLPWYLSKSSLTTVVIDDGVTSIGDHMFYGCSAITDLVIPVDCNYSSETFNSCTNISSVTIAPGATGICHTYSESYSSTPWYFSNGSDTNVIISEGVKELNGYTFAYCNRLSVTIPVSLTKASATDFIGIKGVFVEEGNTILYSDDVGVLYSNNALLHVPNDIQEYIFPETASSISSSAFYGCYRIVSLTIPPSIDELPYRTFYGCTALVSVNISNSVTDIGEESFQNCTSLAELTIPDSVITINGSAFQNCTSLSSVVIGSSVTSIGPNAFRGCTALEGVAIPSSVNSLGSYAFQGCALLESAAIGNGVITIGPYAFQGCTALTELSIGPSVTSIGSYAFQGCSALRELTIPDSVTSLGAYCFFDCSGLERLTIPISLRASDYASGGSEGSYSGEVRYDGMSYYQKVTEGYTGSCYFGGCTGITYLHLTVGDGDGAVYGSKTIAKKNGNTYSPSSAYVYYEITANSYYDYEYLPWYLSKSSLTTVVIDDGVTSIGDHMFYGCSAITCINIPFSTKCSADTSFSSITFCDELGNVLPSDSKMYGYSYAGTAGSLIRIPNDYFHMAYFESNGGSYVSSQETYTGYRIVAPVNPTMTGYSFDGWYLFDNLYNFDTPVSSDVTLTAHWVINQYTVAFDSRGGTPVASQTVDYQSTAVQPLNPEYVRYSFTGWTLNGLAYDFSTVVTSNITLLATWKLNTYTVSFDSDGGTDVSSQTIDSHMSAIKPPTPTRTGYNFLNWTLSGSIYDFSSQVTADIELKATWTKQTFTIRFNSNGGSSVDNQIVEYGSCVTCPDDPFYYGHVFVDWLYNGSSYSFSTQVTSNMTLTASWVALGNRTVTFNSSGGSEVASQTVMTGEYAVRPLDPSREGYTFVYWAYNGSQFDFGTKIVAEMTLIAQWNHISFQVSFDSNGGSPVPAQSVYYGETATVPDTPSRTGYYFTQWTLNGNAYEFTNQVYSDIVLKANWGTYHYTVTFETGEGSEVPSQSVEAGSVAVRPADPVREGYSFSDWLLNGNSYDFTTPVVTDITITAYWIATKYTISFDSNGGSEVPSQYLTHGSVVTRPADPIRTGFNFSEWKANGQSYFFNTGVTGDLTLIATWTDADKVTITFNTEGGSAVSTQIIQIGDTIILPEDPVRPGYIFAGWLVNGQAFDASQPLTSNCMLSASWISETEASDNGLDTNIIIAIAFASVLVVVIVGAIVLRGSTDILKQIEKLQIKPPRGDY